MTDEITTALNEHVAVVEIRRAPNNFFDLELIRALADTYQALDEDDQCRAIVLCSQGKHFCAGADFSARQPDGTLPEERSRLLYREAVRLFRAGKPVVAAVQGAAVGGGLGLAVSADFRVACSEARFVANFARLGFHQGFGLSVTLPRLVGNGNADLMFYTGRRVRGEEAHAMGLADVLVDQAGVRDAAVGLAREIALSAPLAVQSIRRTRRAGLADQVADITEHELREQTRLRATDDFREGVRAMAERRDPAFTGH